MILWHVSAMTGLGQNEPCHSLVRHGRSTSISGPVGPAVGASGLGHKRTNQKSLSPQHRGDVCDDAGEPKQNMDANDGKKDRRSGGYREPAMLVIHCSSPPPQARPRPTSRISNTGQSGAALPEHRATVLANRRSSFFRSLSLALMSSR
jgi:hypothetical protein